jgi:hypothetical protein
MIFFWLVLTKINGTKVRVNFNYVSCYRQEFVTIADRGKITSKIYTLVYFPDVSKSISVLETPEEIDSMLKNFTPIASILDDRNKKT